MTDVYYDPYDYDVDAAAQAVWKRLRDEAPLYWNGRYEFFALSRYDDVLQAILDTETFSSAHATVLELMTPEPGSYPMLIWKDPPEHTWYRKVVNRAFTVRAMNALQDRVAKVCDDLLDRVEGEEEFDFLEDYGAVLPPAMILALIGFPEGFVDEWRHGIDSMFHHEQGETGFRRDQVSSGMTFSGQLLTRLPEFLEERRREPREDLMSVLVDTDVDLGGTVRKLTDPEIFTFVQELSIAGTETVARLMGWVGVLLDRNPDERRALVEDPSLIPNAIEECLRYEAPSPVNGRWVTRDIEIQGRVVPKDSKVLLLNGSANRDERHFADPDRFDVRRKIDRHVSFGYGTHFCIGAALARMEGAVALRAMLARHPTWEVDHDRAEMVHTSTVRGYGKLPVRV